MTDQDKREYPFIIGTAGHIDHGKTSLVAALSGVDTDRLAEEKRRGMTIELGFAPLALPSGKVVSIIDVPGHEKFIRQMVAGAAGIDAVMLVVAADDGVMPQTREHLEILSLLNIRNGLTVVNKIDLVDEEMRELAFEDIRSLLEGTFLADKPVIGVSAVTREGIPELTAAIEKMAAGAAGQDRGGGFFLPVDRVFHMSGFGTVITGTTIRGSLDSGADVIVLPGGTEAKVRSVQAHNQTVEKVVAGQRTAINLSGVSLDGIKRGDVVAAKGYYSATNCLDVRLTVPAAFSGQIEHWQRVRLHIGTSDALARVSLLDREQLMPGESAGAQILPETPLCVYSGARFVIRSYSPVRTIGGGEVLLSLGERPRSKNARAALLTFLSRLEKAQGTFSERLLALIEYKGLISEAEALKLMESDVRALSSAVTSLDAKEKIAVLKMAERYFLSPAKQEELQKRLLEALSGFHAAHPELKGADAEELSRSAGLSDARLVRELLRRFASRQLITLENDKARLNEFIPFDKGEFFKQVESVCDFAKKQWYAIPTIAETQSALELDPRELSRLLAYLKDDKRVAIVSSEYIVFDFLEDDFKEKLSTLPHDNITLAAVRDITGSSRKYILPMLEYFDSKGITRRVGDKRILLKKRCPGN